MRLRSIISSLTSLAFLLSVVGGYFYYSRVKLTLINDANQLASYKITDSKGRFTTFIAEQLKPVQAMAGLKEIRQVMGENNTATLQDVNKILDLFKVTLEADVCYLMDKKGLTLASSNRFDDDSFVGKSFAFRPYFQEAIRGTSAIYMALGVESSRRGVYYSYPVMDAMDLPIGVVVIKASVEKIEDEFTRTISPDETLLLTDPHGIIFITSNKDWLFHALWKLSDRDKRDVAASRQFGRGPWQEIGFRSSSDVNRLFDATGNELLFFEQHFEPFTDWKIIYLRKLPSTSATLLAAFRQPTGIMILTFFLFVTFAVVTLYRKASLEIHRRKEAERALSASEARFRSLYLHTPALLHSIDSSGKILSISDYWSEILGYSREEVLGKQLTDFMTQESKERAEQTVIPHFFRTGFCKDVSYNFIKKNGEIIDVILSAIAEYDDYGGINRSLAVMVDITELKAVEKKLKEASEELNRYSQDLARQVRERTTEISNILQYTPAVVYLKDTEGRYLLINSRFEKLFKVHLEKVRGKRDMDFLDQETARQFEQNDKQVLHTLDPLQVEEQILQEDGHHTYISVKFPLFDDDDNVIGVGGISTDITELKDAQNKLRQMSTNIVSSQERERAAIARELHDELGQALTALRMDAVWLAKKMQGQEGDAALRAHEMSELIDKTIDEVRNMAVRLRPGVLDDLGLIAALEWLVDDFERRFSIPCTFRHQNVPEISDVASTAIYRITQEALTNAARHADASHVEVNLSVESLELYLTIQDDGKGFDPTLVGEAEGLGLAGIRERASLIGASVAIRSGEGNGSHIEVRFLLDHVHITLSEES
ncbi:MAG: PAS domain S-box protein [Desulfobulbaceae bacterium]|nr:PAS domain S-box protein [Desulfobulbaceae bacterium]